MPTQVGLVKPVALEWLGIGRELVKATAVTPAVTIPADKIDPDEKYSLLEDKAMRGVMGSLFSVIPGTQSADVAFGGPVYLDTIGHILLNLFGDYSTTGSTPASATTFTAPLAVGATTGTLTSPAGYTSNSVVQIGTGATAQVVRFTNLAGSVATWANDPIRFAQSGTPAAAIVVAPFTHVFSLLNTGDGQPATHTITHYNGLTGSFLAAQYAYFCASGCSFTMDPDKLFTHDTKGMSYIQQAATGAPTNSISSVQPFPGWQFLVGIGGPATGGTQVFDVAALGVDVEREVKGRWTASGQQAAYVFPRNALTLTGKFTQVAQSEAPMQKLLQNTQPQLQFTATNGLAGASLLSITFDLAKAAVETVKLASGGGEFEYETTFKGVDNATNAGGSGALSPGKVTIVNAISTY